MAQGQIRFSFGLALAQVLIGIFGTKKTGKTGQEKKEAVIDAIEPLINFGAAAAEGNTDNVITKAEIGLGVQALHDTMLKSGLIHDTAALEAGTAPLAIPSTPAVTVTAAAPVAAPAVAQPVVSEQAKYQQWLRLPNPGTMPTNEMLKAQLFVVGDQIFSDGDQGNAPEFYFVLQANYPSIPMPVSPTGRAAHSNGRVG